MPEFDFKFIVSVLSNLIVFGLLVDMSNGLFLPVFLGGFVLYFVKPLVSLEVYYSLMIFIMIMGFMVFILNWLFFPSNFDVYVKFPVCYQERKYYLYSIYKEIESFIYS